VPARDLSSQGPGATVRYLPPYSLELNPIELAFSKFKKLLRDGAKREAQLLRLMTIALNNG
jgi:transposase